jgi:hypothetical protein
VQKNQNKEKNEKNVRLTPNQQRLKKVQQLLEYYGEDNQHLQNEKHLTKIGLNGYDVEKIIEIFKLPFNERFNLEEFNTITHDKGDWPDNEFRIELITEFLSTGAWVNDDVINNYYKLLQVRDQKNDRKSLFFYCFYLTALYLKQYINEERNVYDFDVVLNKFHKEKKNIEKLKNVFEMDKIFFPVFKDDNHWSLIVIYVQQKRINYYDSRSTRDAGSYGDVLMSIIKMWLFDVANKFDISGFNFADWTCVTTDKKTVPQQDNSNDCGIFCIMFTDYLANNYPLEDNVIQKYVAHFRILIAITYLNKKLVY